MIERTEVGRSGGSDAAALVVDDDVIRSNSQFTKHGRKERSFVLAVTVTVGEGLLRRMGLPAADAQFDGDIANVALGEFSERGHFGEKSLFIGGEFGNFL